MPSQAGQPQPMPTQSAGPFPAVVAGHRIPGTSSATAQRRAADDEIERLVQLITDQIVRPPA